MWISVRYLVAAIVLFGFTPAAEAWAQDLLNERYEAIRAPTEALIHRIARQRLQADLNALGRDRARLRIQQRLTERLRFEYPVSGFTAAGRALDARLDRIDIERREIAARLADQARKDGDRLDAGTPSLRTVDGADADMSPDPTQFDERSATDAVAAARAFVDELLIANQARP